MRKFILENKMILLILSAISLIGLFGYLYISALGNMWSTTTDDRPYFITTEPIVVRNITLPIGAEIRYKQKWFWQKNRQKEPLNEEDVEYISLHSQHEYIEWAGVPIVSIGLSTNKNYLVIYPDFRKMSEKKKTKFSQLWQNCDEYATPYGELYIRLKNTNDWSFNKENIVDIYSCSNQTRGVSSVLESHNDKVLDTLYRAMLEVKIQNTK